MVRRPHPRRRGVAVSGLVHFAQLLHGLRGDNEQRERRRGMGWDQLVDTANGPLRSGITFLYFSGVLYGCRHRLRSQRPNVYVDGCLLGRNWLV